MGKESKFGRRRGKVNLDIGGGKVNLDMGGKRK